MICDDEEADQGQAQDDKEDGAEDEEGEVI
jgi:hypothetical protein